MSRGFTLIEVLVVIAITTLLAGLILTYSSSSRDQVAIAVEQARLAQTIAKAKSLTLSTYNRPAVPCGYGVHFNYDSGTYTLFSYEAPTCVGLTQLDPVNEHEVTTETLPTNLAFKDPTADENAIGEIMFTPPDPGTFIWLYDQPATTTAGDVPLTSKSGSVSASVTVSGAGQISFAK